MDKKHLEKVQDITEGIPVFDLREIKDFAQHVLNLYEEVCKRYNVPTKDVAKVGDLSKIDNFELVKRLKPDKILDWGINDVLSMWAKGLNPSALTAASSTSQFLVEHVGRHTEERSGKVYAELGCGAGWSTVILSTLIFKQSKKNRLLSFDRSLASIACTAALLRKYDINYRIISSDEIMKSLSDGDNKVLLVYDEEGFLGGVSKIDQEILSGIYSNHGDAYADVNYRSDLMAKLLNISKRGTVYVSDCLYDEFSLKFDKLWVMWQMTFGRPLSKMSGRKEFDYMRTRIKGSQKSIVRMLDDFSKPILNLGNYYILHDLVSFRLLLNCLELSTLWQRRLISAVQSPVRSIDSKFLSSVASKSSSGKEFEKYKISPTVPVYISTLALRVK